MQTHGLDWRQNIQRNSAPSLLSNRNCCPCSTKIISFIVYLQKKYVEVLFIVVIQGNAEVYQNNKESICKVLRKLLGNDILKWNQ